VSYENVILVTIIKVLFIHQLMH